MIEYRIYPAKNLVVARMLGDISFTELLNWHYELFDHTDYSSCFTGIADMRKANMMISVENIQELVAINKEKQMVTGKWVCLVDTPVETALAMTYKDEKSDSHAMELFATESAAAAYLDLDVKSAIAQFNTDKDILQFSLIEG